MPKLLRAELPMLRIVDALGSYLPTMRAMWLPGHSDVDFTGNGWNLTRPTGAPIARVGNKVGLNGLGLSSNELTLSVSMVADTEHLLCWAWIYTTGSAPASSYLAGRGQDGFGSGWSFQLYISTGQVTCAAVVNGAQYTCGPLGAIPCNRWVLIHGAVNHHSGANPSYVTVSQNGARLSATNVAGNTGLRSSTKGFEIGGVPGTPNQGTIIGACGVLAGPATSTTYPIDTTEMPIIYGLTSPIFTKNNAQSRSRIAVGGAAPLSNCSLNLRQAVARASSY